MQLPSARRSTLLAALALFLGSSAAAPRPAPAAEGARLELRIATLAPKNSAWAKALEQGAREADKQTEGRLRMKYYFSGQQGDERDVVRKMQSGQLDGGVLTAVGLGLIVPEVRVLELPTMFATVKELDFVRDAMTPTFEKLFADKGYILVSWGDVGWVHTFGKEKFDTIDKIRKAKTWVWTDDPLTRAMQKRLGINGVPLGVPQVLSSLSTGQIDSCYGSPLAAVALQWYTQIKYASDSPLSYAIGGFVVRKDVWDKLSADDQAKVLAGARANSKKIIAGIRKDNERAKKAMAKNGVVFVPAPPATMAVFMEAAQGVWKDLTGQLYDQQLLDEVLAHRAKARGK